MRRLLEKLRLVRLVWLEEGSGEYHLRIVRYRTNGPVKTPRFLAVPILSTNPAILLPDGRTSGCGYIKRWYPYNSRSPQPTNVKETALPHAEVDNEWPEYVSGSWR